MAFGFEIFSLLATVRLITNRRFRRVAAVMAAQAASTPSAELDVMKRDLALRVVSEEFAEKNALLCAFALFCLYQIKVDELDGVTLGLKILILILFESFADISKARICQSKGIHSSRVEVQLNSSIFITAVASAIAVG
eukprot:CAMPEP_0202047984 /NCGR_PEP_ID=MMETSP0963-20130614/2358_1 /ASSEMBLY_ACC=CAM_ASM_000494 /TAXON_ID=4773 /ORGANISM="Schizochytrium aggregatum, Strain ATCC28209" /LENGTH=137 /DNA_ID=CAMNT_0048612803 /DNA_START=25 /DNA_END=434 /DNA_ORIENTATION=+